MEESLQERTNRVILSDRITECQTKNTEDTENRKQRFNYYAYADYAFIKNCEIFIKRQEQKILNKYGHQKFVDYLVKWKKWFDMYLSTGKTDDMPESWSSSEPLPISIILT